MLARPRLSGSVGAALPALITPRKPNERWVGSTAKPILIAVIACRARKSLSDIAFCQIAKWGCHRFQVTCKQHLPAKKRVNPMG